MKAPKRTQHRAVRAGGLAVIGSLLPTCGLILDTIVKLHHESYELHLNRRGLH